MRSVWIVTWTCTVTTGNPDQAKSLAARGIVSTVRKVEQSIDFFVAAADSDGAVNAVIAYCTPTSGIVLDASPTGIVDTGITASG